MIEKTMLKLLNNAMKKQHLYSDEEIIFMKKQISEIKTTLQEKRKTSSKGFGK
jgi:hypothetical protein